MKYLPLIFLFLVGCTPKTATQLSDNTLQIQHRQPDLKPDRYNVAFLVMDGVYNTELTAPYDIFQHTIFRKGVKQMNTFIVANTRQPINTFEGMRILPDYNYLKDELPPIDILVVPSAEGHLDKDLKDEKMLEFVRKTAETAQYVTSHCDGSFVLAKAGILDGVESTTFPGDVAAYRNMFPSLTVHEDVLFVHDGKFITSAGGAKSFEASLYLCEVLYGKAITQRLAKGMVIDWNLEGIKYLVVRP